MPAYLGTLGRLMPIRCTAQPVTTSERYTFQRTLEGKVKAQWAAVASRSWEVSLGLATADQVSALWSFADGEWGIGPFVWITPEAQVTNMLTPEVASCGPAALVGPAASTGPPVDLGGGAWAGRSLVNSDPSATLYFSNQRFPVLPGVPVTGSAWVLGAGSRARLHWYGADGNGLGVSHTSSEAGLASTLTQLSVSANPPKGAVACGVSAINTVQAARPAMTWTAGKRPYSPGAGCHKAVIDAPERDPRLLTQSHYRANASFTITEVG